MHPTFRLRTWLLVWWRGAPRFTLLPTEPGDLCVTEIAFKEKGLSAAELARVTSFCGFIQSNGSGFGICRSCRLGGLGATSSN